MVKFGTEVWTLSKNILSKIENFVREVSIFVKKEKRKSISKIVFFCQQNHWNFLFCQKYKSFFRQKVLVEKIPFFVTNKNYWKKNFLKKIIHFLTMNASSEIIFPTPRSRPKKKLEKKKWKISAADERRGWRTYR